MRGGNRQPACGGTAGRWRASSGQRTTGDQ